MRKLQRTIQRVAALGVVLAGTAGAQLPEGLVPSVRNPPTRQGTRGANFLQIGIGARAQAMGGAVVSNVEGPTAWYWNPAGAASTESFSIAATRLNLYEGLDITMNYAGITLPVFGGAFGITFNSLNSGDMLRTAEFAPFGDATVGENFNYTATAVSLGYARRLTDRLDIGGDLKFVSEGLTDVKTSWVAIDMGTQFRTGIYGMTIGASLQNIGPSGQARGELVRRIVATDQAFFQNTSLDLDTQETDLPTLFRFSVGTDLLGSASSVFGPGGGMHTVNGELSFFDAIDTNLQFAYGAEYGFRNLAFLRVGKRFYNDDRVFGSEKGMYGLSGGLGLRLPLSGRAVRFDYAYTSLGELRNVQVFSFEFGR